jgi:hypothetical protein
MTRAFIAAALAAASLSAAPAVAAIVTTDYTISGGTSGTFTLDFNTVGSTYTLTALNLTIPGGSTTFTTANSGLQFPLGPTLTLGGNVSNVDNILVSGGADDFLVSFDATLASQSSTLSYFVAGTQIVPFTTVTISQGSAAVPEPASWAMMLLGFGGMGLVMRRNGAPRVRRTTRSGASA